MYIDFIAGDKTYKLRINTRAIVALEKALGCNPLAVFGDGETIPTITSMVAVLHASLQQYQHGISMSDAYDIYDAYLADGNTAIEFVQVMLEIYKVSGLIPKNVEVDTEKN